MVKKNMNGHLFDKNKTNISIMKPRVSKKFDPLKVISLRTLITKRKYPEPTFFVKPFLPEGLTILAGKAKIKKSFFSLDMAISIARGKKFLRKFQCQKSAVYYIPLEDNFPRVQRRARTMLGKLTYIPKNLIIPCQVRRFPKLNQGGFQALKDIIKHRPEIKVIVIDTMGRFVDKKNFGNPNYQIDYDALADLQSFAITKHISILLIHHAIKSNATDPYDEIQGSMGTQAAVDNLMIIRNYKGSVQLCVRGRDFDPQEFIIEFDSTTCQWFVVGSNPEYGLGRTALKFLQLFKDNPQKEFSFRELHSFIKSRTKANTTNRLRPFIEKKLIKHTDRNVYKLHPVTFDYLIGESSANKEKD